MQRTDDLWRWCRGVQRWCRAGAEVQRYRGAGVQRYRGTGVQRQRCRGAEMQRCRVTKHVQRCRVAVVQTRSRGGA